MIVRIRINPARFRSTAANLALAGALVGFANPASELPVEAPKADPRAERLGRFFRLYNCTGSHVMEYLRAADEHGLDYRLLPAISVRETGCGATARENNYWGYHPGRQTFPSVADGIDYLARVLAEGEFYRGKSTEEKLFTYNPLTTYPHEVQRIMRQIE
jgi:hypothetical protein